MKLDTFSDEKIRIKFVNGHAYELEKNENITFGAYYIILMDLTTGQKTVYPHSHVACIDYNNPRKLPE